tara:strand:- start:29 stop:583 length:555 start_codon:yes stop_codon:yes gene_type:complete
MELREKINLVRQIAQPATGLPKSTLLNLMVGSVVRMDSSLFMVEEAFNYTEANKHGDKKKFTWKEYMLRDLNDFSIRFLEVEDDDGLHAYLTGDKIAQGRLSETPSKNTKTLTVQGVSAGDFYLEEFCHAIFSGKKGDEQVLMLDYEADNGELLGVEVWEGGNCEAFLYTEVKTKHIEVIAHAE